MATLSEGSLDIILEQLNDQMTPIVQILGTKVMANNRLRSVIFDGQTICQHCIFISDQLDQMYQEGKLDKFTVVRLENYSVSSLPKKENMPVILVNKLEILKSGQELGKKLEKGERFSSGSGGMGSSRDQFSNSMSSMSTPNRNNNFGNTSMSNNSNPNMSMQTSLPSLKSENVCPINVLTPFFNAWVIRVRVTNKGALRTYANKKGDGKLFNFDVCDESGEIRITAFNTECDRFYNMIEKDKVYYVSKGQIKAANKKFNSLNNDYEIMLSNTSIIEQCHDTAIAMPKLRYKFVNLVDLNNTAVNTLVDVIGVIHGLGAPDSFISKKSGKELIKQEIQIVDKSLAEARVTIWNNMVDDFSGQIGQIVAFKGVVVGEFKGKTLSCGGSSTIEIEPEIPETHVMRTWFNTHGANAVFVPLSKPSDGSSISNDYRFTSQINTSTIVAGPQNYFTLVGLIQSTNRSNNHLYKSCGQGGCQKKVTEENDGTYFCSKCDRQSTSFAWRLMLSLLISDATGMLWVTVFQENAEKLLGKNAQEMAILYENDQNEYMEVINTIRFKKFVFRVGSRLDEYNNESRIRSSAMSINPISPVDRAKRLMTMIDVLKDQIAA